jgi:hypothetical protein
MWDGVSLRAETDRYGFFPLFYHVWDDGIMLSPSLTALIEAGAPTELDNAAIAVALRLWLFLGDDTPFARIRVLPAGGTLEWKPGTPFSVATAFVFGREVSMSRSAAIDEYIDRFRAAISRRPAKGTGLVPLSGGRDSRHIFLEMCSSGTPPDAAITVSGWRQETQDAQIAATLARRAGVKHVTVGLPDSRWDAQLACMRATHLCTFEHWWLENLIGHFREHEGNLSIYEGAAGDVLSTAVLKDPARRGLYDAGKFRELANSMLGAEAYFQQVLPAQWYTRFNREHALHRLAAELERHRPAPNPLASFFVYNRTRRVTALPPTTLFSPYGTVWCPYLDADVWDFLSSLPADILASEEIFGFHDDAIHRAYPEFSDIPFAAKWGVKPRPRSYDLRTIRDIAAGVVPYRHIPLRRTYLYPRLAKGLVVPSYTAGAADTASLVSYLAALSIAAEL